MFSWQVTGIIYPLLTRNPHDTESFLCVSPIEEIFRVFFNTVFTTPCHLSLSWAISIQSQQTLYVISLFLVACHMLHPPLDYHNIYYGIKIQKRHNMHFLYLLSSSLLGRIFSWPPSAYVLPVMWETKYHTHITTHKIIFLCTLVFMLLDTGRGDSILGIICWLQWADNCANYFTSVKGDL